MTAPGYLAPGALLQGRYEIVREIGRGGYSVVYLARDRSLDADVALKLLVPPPAAAQVARERMRREVQAVRGLSHANIVAVFDFLEEGPWSFIVMEYVRGPDLQVRVAERGRLDADAAVRLGRDVAGALSAAHRHGILHRDVKPQNILLDPDGRARLTDFGSAKLDGQLGVTGSGALAGTLAYTAPESLAGRRGDARSDLYALGLTLYYALTGNLPERASPHLPPTPSATGFRPQAEAPGVPGWLDDVIARATCAAAEDRFPTAAALDEALARPGAADALLTEAGAACLLCAGPDPLGARSLSRVRRLGRRGRHARLSPPAAGGAARRAAAQRLELVLPDVGGDAALAAASGERPVFRVSRAGVPRVTEAMERHELATHPVPLAGAWGAVPRKAWMLAGAAVTAGAVAGSVAMPMLLWTSSADRHARAARRPARRAHAARGAALARRLAAARARARGGGRADRPAAGHRAEPPGRRGAHERRALRHARPHRRRARPRALARRARHARPAAPRSTSPISTRTSAGSSASASASSPARPSGSTRSPAASAPATRWCSGCSRP